MTSERDMIGAMSLSVSVLRRVLDDSGREIDASFRIESTGDLLSIVFESRGGTRGTSTERNTDYAKGLEVLLARLGGAHIRISDALVISRNTETLPESRRRLQVAGHPFPIAVTDAADLRRAMSAAQARAGRAPGALGGGNPTKRLRLILDGGETQSIEALARILDGVR